MMGYFNKPEETDGHDPHGQGRASGGCTPATSRRSTRRATSSIVDRKKDMIIVSGFNVYPTDVEQVLYRHPKIEKVAVAGIPDSKTGEAVKAYIVLKAGETATAEEIIEWCRDDKTGLTGYRVPKLVEFRESLPETMVGKILRRVLVEEEKQKAAAAAAERPSSGRRGTPPRPDIPAPPTRRHPLGARREPPGGRPDAAAPAGHDQREPRQAGVAQQQQPDVALAGFARSTRRAPGSPSAAFARRIAPENPASSARATSARRPGAPRERPAQGPPPRRAGVTTKAPARSQPGRP